MLQYEKKRVKDENNVSCKYDGEKLCQRDVGIEKYVENRTFYDVFPILGICCFVCDEKSHISLRNDFEMLSENLNT